MRTVLVACLLFVSVAAFGGKTSDEEFSYGIATTHLIAHPERFNGRTVIVMGYLKIRGSYSALFVSRQDLEDGLTFNSVGIVNDGNEKFLKTQNDRKPVLIEAVFEANPPEPGLGHATSGRLTKLRSLSPLPKLVQ